MQTTLNKPTNSFPVQWCVRCINPSNTALPESAIPRCVHVSSDVNALTLGSKTCKYEYAGTQCGTLIRTTTGRKSSHKPKVTAGWRPRAPSAVPALRSFTRADPCGLLPRFTAKASGTTPNELEIRQTRTRLRLHSRARSTSRVVSSTRGEAHFPPRQPASLKACPI